MRKSIMDGDFLREIVAINLSMALDSAVQSSVSSQHRCMVLIVLRSRTVAMDLLLGRNEAVYFEDEDGDK